MITVCTCTVGKSALRLETLLCELRAFTSLPFRHLVSDDRTPNQDFVDEQKYVCDRYGAEHFINQNNPSLPGNLNFLASKCETPWLLFIEDGVRPSQGWLEAALSLVQQLDRKKFCGRSIGMAGFSHIQSWMLALGGAFQFDVMAMFRDDEGALEAFYSEWNDGLWSWSRLLPVLRRRILEKEAERWTNEVQDFSFLAMNFALPPTMQDPMERRQTFIKFFPYQRWPISCHPVIEWYPGGFLLVHRETLLELGGFRKGCTFYEGHLGIRMAKAGYLSLFSEFPPFLHHPSQCFRDVTKYEIEKQSPRNHQDTDLIFKEDFGCGFREAWKRIAVPSISGNDMVEIAEQLDQVEVAADSRWSPWME